MIKTFDLQLIYEKLCASAQQQANPENKEITLILGRTGSGKSTIVNYLMEYPLIKGKGGKAYPAPNSGKPPADMGDYAESITSFPMLYENPKQKGLLYCDCPGFLIRGGLKNEWQLH